VLARDASQSGQALASAHRGARGAAAAAMALRAMRLALGLAKPKVRRSVC
jgi:hypothetical protein